MFVHHVFFWLNNADSEADKNALIKGLQQLSSIEEIKQVHIGTPASTNRAVIERGYAVSLLLMFDNLQDQEVYQVHPVHKQFIAQCASLWSKVVIYDSVDVA